MKQTRAPSTIHFDGLSPLEIRGQCALVRKVVMNALPKPEADAICAWYGHAATKAKGIYGIRDYSRHRLSTTSEEATLAIAWSVYATGWRRKYVSTRKISKEYGLSQSTVMRDKERIAENARALETYAIEHLTPIFEGRGLIEMARDH
ncbi:hypothetical protein [Mycoavidus sp. SF9855]|uniref:hypothetical protein n=1 Tax=Mycoavidus sp. SF9855 TaxID=2968475 RepID=UPI00211CFF6F|nr:hypothetical protein [Mycoavidus sp. SF9855]UUM20947.1 hypothetical protein NQD60_05545 [Mycoavidus sp. SF9855]